MNKVLAISDVKNGKGVKKIVDEVKPDIVVLAGDLASDGFASFWGEAAERIRAYQDELKRLNISLEKKGNITFYKWVGKRPEAYKNKHVLEVVMEVREKYRHSKEFLEIRKRIHVDKFYQFLEFAGKKSPVLVVKGDHDEDFAGDYSPDKINEKFGCGEISGKLVVIGGLRILGLGFNETYYLRKLKPLIEDFRGKVDVVVTHCGQSKLPIISSLKPKIIIRCHFGSGKYLVNDVPSAFTADVKYTVIELEGEQLPKITQYVIARACLGMENGRSSC